MSEGDVITEFRTVWTSRSGEVKYANTWCPASLFLRNIIMKLLFAGETAAHGQVWHRPHSRRHSAQREGACISAAG
jgi:hypothetical protein